MAHHKLSCCSMTACSKLAAQDSGLQQAGKLCQLSVSMAWDQDFSDLVAAKAAQQKRKAAERKEGKAKKAKDSFKF